MIQEEYNKEKHGEWAGPAYPFQKPKLNKNGEPYIDTRRHTVMGFSFEMIKKVGPFCGKFVRVIA